MRAKYLLLFFICIGFISCKKEVATSLPERGSLISYNYITTLTPAEVVQNFPEQSEYSENISTLVHYKVKIFYYDYSSIYKNQPIKLSGLIMVPDTSIALPILTYLHGTMKPYPLPEGEGNEDIPSIYKGEFPDASWKQGETRLFGSYSASHGYITILPDYAGYNVSANVSHPYTIHRELAAESVDAILAAQEFIKKENIQTTGKTFLSGWSEGAGASLAAQKEIEANYLTKINLIACGNFAGPYDMKSNGDLVVLMPLSFWSWDPLELDDNMWSLYATNLFSDNPIPNNQLFKFNVVNETSVMKDRPGNIPLNLFQPAAIGNQQIKNEFYKNDLINGWSPSRKVFFYYGTEDTNVFPSNNVNAYNAFKSKGADVTLIKYIGDNHYTPVLKYYIDMMYQFDLLK